MNWIPKVSLVNLDDLAGAVNKISESVKNIEKNFDNALGFQEAEAGAQDVKNAPRPSEVTLDPPSSAPQTDENSNYFSDPISSNVSAFASSFPSFLSLKPVSSLDSNQEHSHSATDPPEHLSADSSSPLKLPSALSDGVASDSTDVSTKLEPNAVGDSLTATQPLPGASVESIPVSSSDHLKLENDGSVDSAKETEKDEPTVSIEAPRELRQDSMNDSQSNTIILPGSISPSEVQNQIAVTENSELTKDNENRIQDVSGVQNEDDRPFQSSESKLADPTLIPPTEIKVAEETQSDISPLEQTVPISSSETGQSDDSSMKSGPVTHSGDESAFKLSDPPSNQPLDYLAQSKISKLPNDTTPTDQNKPENVRDSSPTLETLSPLPQPSPLEKTANEQPTEASPRTECLEQNSTHEVVSEDQIEPIPSLPSEKADQLDSEDPHPSSLGYDDVKYSQNTSSSDIEIQTNENLNGATVDNHENLNQEGIINNEPNHSKNSEDEVHSLSSVEQSLAEVHPPVPSDSILNSGDKPNVCPHDLLSSSLPPSHTSESNSSLHQNASEINTLQETGSEINEKIVSNFEKETATQASDFEPTSRDTKEFPESADPILPNSSDLLTLVSDSEMLEVALRAAAKQSQIKADELARYMAMNDELKAQIEDLKQQQRKNNDTELNALREEYTHRLSAAERKVYALTKERDMLKREQSRKSDVSSLLKEKDEIIKQVMAEGEELSKKQATQEAFMKKLRSQIRELEEEKQRLNTRISTEESKVESIKKDKLATEKALQEIVEKNALEVSSLKENYTRLLAAAEERVLLAEAKADSHAKADLDRKLREASERENTLILTVEELRQSLTRLEQQHAFREDRLKRDVSDLEERCKNAESRCEDLIARMPDSTRPLLRQIEAIQESAKMRMEALSGVERALNARLQEAEAKAAMAQEKERVSSERLSQTLSRLAVLEAQLGCLKSEHSQLSKSLEKERARASEMRQENLISAEIVATHEVRSKQLEMDFNELKEKFRQDYAEEKKKREELEQEVKTLRASVSDYEKKIKEGRLSAFHQSIPVVDKDTASRRMSTTSFDGADDSVSVWSRQSYGQNQSEVNQSRSPRNLIKVFPSSREQLESMLRQKDGEISSLTSRLATLESTRDALAEELVNTTTQLETVKNDIAAIPGLRSELAAIRRRHASALELMGERDEQVEELRADLEDVKEMYREQIDMLVNKIEQLSLHQILPSN